MRLLNINTFLNQLRYLIFTLIFSILSISMLNARKADKIDDTGPETELEFTKETEPLADYDLSDFSSEEFEKNLQEAEGVSEQSRSAELTSAPKIDFDGFLNSQDEGLVRMQIILEEPYATYMDLIYVVLLQTEQYDKHVSDEEKVKHFKELNIIALPKGDLEAITISRADVAKVAIKLNNLDRGMFSWITGSANHYFADALYLNIADPGTDADHPLSGREMVGILDKALLEKNARDNWNVKENPYTVFGFDSYEALDKATPDYNDELEAEVNKEVEEKTKDMQAQIAELEVLISNLENDAIPKDGGVGNEKGGINNEK